MVIKMKYEKVLIQTEESVLYLVNLKEKRIRSCSGVRESLRIQI